jgi:hypothetical protein
VARLHRKAYVPEHDRRRAGDRFGEGPPVAKEDHLFDSSGKSRVNLRPVEQPALGDEYGHPLKLAALRLVRGDGVSQLYAWGGCLMVASPRIRKEERDVVSAQAAVAPHVN